MRKLKYLLRRYRLSVAIIIVFALALIGFFISFYISSGDRKEQGKDYSIGDLTMKVTDSNDENRNLQEEITNLGKTYKEAVAWLKVAGTSIDTPIFQFTDNEKYLRINRDGENTKWGENFLDYECDLSKINDPMQHYIIYGHNTEADSRFSPLLNYKNKEFYDSHKYIELATKEGVYNFEIFSVYKTTTDFYYINTTFESLQEYSDFITSLKSKSDYETDIGVSENDVILTLSTCDYSISDGRYVVEARLIK